MNRTLLILIAIACTASELHATEVSLREHAQAAGPLLLLGDIADIHAATPARRNELATTPLMPTPPKDQAIFLRSAQVRDLLVSRGMDLRGVIFRGAMQVEVGGDVVIPSARQNTASRLDTQQRLQDAIALHLSRQTGHAEWQVDISVSGTTATQFGNAGGQLSVSGGQEPWLGRQRFEVQSGESVVTVLATVRRVEQALFVVRNVERGMILRPSDVELKTYQGRLPANSVTSLASVVGKEARQGLRAGTLLIDNQLTAPRLVERGETVTVYARTGGVLVRTLAVAEQHGAAGELVRVKTLDGKDRYAARVSGHRELEVYATGVNASDLALRNRKNTLTR